MTNIEERVQAIKTRLNLDDTAELILIDDFTKFLEFAKAYTGNSYGDAMLFAVQNATEKAYQQRGAEGFTSNGAGGQSYTMRNVFDELKQELKATVGINALKRL